MKQQTTNRVIQAIEKKNIKQLAFNDGFFISGNTTSTHVSGAQRYSIDPKEHSISIGANLNKKRVKIFQQLMDKRNIETVIIEPEGNNIIEELFASLVLFDYISYYLAEEYKIDPEPVKMVDKFKKKLK